MKVIETDLAGVLVFEPKVFSDPRGYFIETYSANRYRDAGLKTNFVQDNISFSIRGTLRGLHYQLPHSQAKLVHVLEGSDFDDVVDIRQNSMTFGRWFGIALTEEKHNQMYIPSGFAHGFYVLSETALFSYKCSDYYAPEAEKGIAWNDPDIGIEWPLLGEPTISEKDMKFDRLADLPDAKLPRMEDR
ncbi:MAG: dTDP-4-dehydrorhamnose 3,5-epimerase [Acidobacteriota bacterium]